MNNQNRLYNQPPQRPRQKAKNTWKQRLLGNPTARPLTLRQERTLPVWMVNGPVVAFFAAFVACTVVYGYAMPLVYAAYSIISVFLFFYGGKYLSTTWQGTSERRFAKNLFIWSLVIRLIWVVFCYFVLNPNIFGFSYGYGDDVGAYMDVAKEIALWMQDGSFLSFNEFSHSIGVAVDDLGYSTWLAVLYVVSFNSSDVFVPLIVKAILSAYSCMCIYHVAKRHFGEGTARLAGLFMCLNPNMLFWCSCLLKETEMVFLCCVYIDKTDEVLSSGKKMTFKGLLPGLLAALTLFFFRTVLGLVALLAILTHVVFASHRVMSAGKKVFAGLFVVLVLALGFGDRIRMQSDELLEQVRGGQQEANMEWRAKRVDEGGRTQSFASYAGAAVFAPMIFTIPFPTFNMANEAHVSQALLSGGNYIKNILSFFVIYVFIIMLLSGEWRRHVFILAYTLGYHLVLVMSNFAQSGRFHMPVWPMLLLFAAYGIQLAKTNPKIRKWLPLALVFEVVICLAWGWFKLKGRGMI